MASGEDAKTPFLNDYKLQFFWRRFPQTLSGGLRLNLGAPYYVYLYQILVFLWPFVIGGIFTALSEFEILDENICCYIYSALMASTIIFVHFLRLSITRNSTNGSKESRHNVLAEDDEMEFVSCCDTETFGFIFPAKTYTLNIISHGLLSGLLCGLSFLHLLPSTIEKVYLNTGPVVVLFTFGWLTLCIANHSLTVQPPPETAIFRSLDDLQLSSLMRPFYVSVITVIGILARHRCPGLQDINKALYILLVLLPLIWMVGLLPPLDALFAWLGEQFLVFCAGGTYMASDFRLFVALVLSGIVLFLACFITNYVALVTFCSLLGFLLSLDLYQLADQVMNRLVKENTSLKFHHKWTVPETTKHIITLLACTGVAAVSSHFYKDATRNMFDAFGYVFVVLFLLLKVLGDLQYIYICAGLIRNPLYTTKSTSLVKLKKFHLQMRYLGQVYKILLTCVCPLVMVAFLGNFLNTSQLDLASFTIALGTLRALRWVWQNTLKCLLEMIILCIIVWCDISSAWWNTLGVGLQLMLIGLACDRLNDFFEKSKFMLTMFITSWSEPKQRHRATIPTFITSLLLFPLVFSILVISVALSAPLKPLFCFPIFFVGFPRPKRSWPSLSAQSSGSSEGSVFYEQLVPKVCQVLQETIASGTILTKSDFILVRYQDRFIIIQVLERGYKYCTVIARGLELQETSCHTVEAAMVDDIFEEVFCKERSSGLGLNHHMLNTLTPSQCLVLETYSDTHNVLTGVIDQPRNIKRQSTNFMKCLTWVLLNYQKEKKESSLDSRSSIPENLGQAEDSSDLPGENGVTNIHLKPENVTFQNVKASCLTTPVENFDDQCKNKKPDAEWSDMEWSEDDSDIEENSKKRTKLDLGSSLGDPLMSFGLPAQDIGKKVNTGRTMTESVHLLHRQKTDAKTLPHAKVLPVDGNPTDFPFTDLEQPFACANLLHTCKRVMPPIHAELSEAWLDHVFKNREAGLYSQTTEESKESKALLDYYKAVIISCFAVVNILGLHGTVLDAGAAHIYRVYHGRLPWSPELDLLEQDSKLKHLVVKAFRYAFKLTYDEAVLGEIDDEDELLENLKDYEENWFIGVENKPGWNEAILQEKQNLFSIDYDADKNTYTSHLLSKQELGVYTGTLNSEAVRAQWASLALELLYLTNDDEERYSIQAHPLLLRNLTIQSADPPLGYAVYSTGPIQVPYGLF